MITRNDFNYIIEKHGSETICRVFYKNECFHAFGTTTSYYKSQRHRKNYNSYKETAEAAIQQKMAQLEKKGFSE